MQTLSDMVHTNLILLETTILISRMVAPFYIPTSNVWMINFLYSFRFLCCYNQLILADFGEGTGKKQKINQKQVNNSKIWSGIPLTFSTWRTSFFQSIFNGSSLGDFPIYSFYSAMRSGSLSDQIREKKRWWGRGRRKLLTHHYPGFFSHFDFHPWSICYCLFWESFPVSLHIFSRVLGITIASYRLCFILAIATIISHFMNSQTVGTFSNTLLLQHFRFQIS